MVGQATEECGQYYYYNSLLVICINLVRRQLGLDKVLGSSDNAELLSDVIIKCQYILYIILLVVIVARCIDDKPLLFPCGNLRKEILPQRLHEAGIGLHSLICYETCPHSQLETNIRTIVSAIYLSVSLLSLYLELERWDKCYIFQSIWCSICFSYNTLNNT